MSNPDPYKLSRNITRETQTGDDAQRAATAHHESLFGRKYADGLPWSQAKVHGLMCDVTRSLPLWQRSA